MKPLKDYVEIIFEVLALAVLVPNFDSAYFPGGLSWLQVVWNFSMVMGRIGDGPVAMHLFMLAGF